MLMNLLGLWICIGGLFGGIIQLIVASQDYYEDDDIFQIRNAFWFAIHFYERHEGELNRAGMIIAIAFILITTLPGTVLVVLLCCGRYLLLSVWKLFKYLFRKRNRGKEGSENC